MREDVRNISSICPNCFATLKGDSCPACGKDFSDTVNPPPALPVRYIMGSKYLTGKVLGIGGFGITYLGWDLSESRKLAIKEFFPRDFATRDSGGEIVNVKSPETVSQYNHWLNAFIEEAKILMRIKHLGGVVKLLDYFENNNTAYIVTDYLEGSSLREYLTAHNYKLTWDETLKILNPVLTSLMILHSYGVIHNDISPENIIIVLNKYVKLIDFGAAILYKVSNAARPYVVLKNGYSPLELYRPTARSQGPWTDVYQIGATMYNCITGYIPPVATEREKDDRLPKPSDLKIELPLHVEDALMKALAVFPQDRYSSIDDFMFDLRL